MSNVHVNPGSSRPPHHAAIRPDSDVVVEAEGVRRRQRSWVARRDQVVGEINVAVGQITAQIPARQLP